MRSYSTIWISIFCSEFRFPTNPMMHNFISLISQNDLQVMSSAMVLLLPMILLITSDRAVSDDNCNRSVKLLLPFAVFSLMTTHPYITLICFLFVFKTKFYPTMLLQPLSKWDNRSMRWYVQTTLYYLNILYSCYFERKVPNHALKQQEFSVSLSIWKNLSLSYHTKYLLKFFLYYRNDLKDDWFNFLLFRKFTKLIF